ncbi:MAG TPA: hypothetical protein VMV98_09930 [Acidobacteriaceae bacterium]|nr:hypothetical protein [Acidobacteriaceae bacterium]
MEAINKYYSDGIVSVESSSGPGMPAEMKGIEAIKEKNKRFFDNNELNGEEVNGPFVGENQFAVQYTGRPVPSLLLQSAYAIPPYEVAAR